MSNFLVSSFSLLSTPRSAVFRAQDELAKAQREVVTGRHFDVGMTLGVSVSRTISMRAELSNAEKLITANTGIAQRFKTLQAMSGSIASMSENLLSSLISSGRTDVGTGTAMQQATSATGQLTGALNGALGSRYLFSGAATDKPAMKADLVDGYAGSAASAATDATWQAFLASNAGGDPANVTKADLETFLADGGAFDQLFNASGAGDAWKDNWSDASDVAVLSRIDDNEIFESSASANDPAFRTLAKAFAMLSSLQASDLGDEARDLLVERAIETLGQGISQLTELRTDIGGKEERLEQKRETLLARTSVLEISIAETEEVDAYEASTRVTNLMNVLETSYALTSRISRLSLLNYL